MSIRGRKGVQVRQTVQRRIEGTVGICVLSKIPSCVHAMGDLVFGHNFKYAYRTFLSLYVHRWSLQSDGTIAY